MLVIQQLISWMQYTQQCSPIFKAIIFGRFAMKKTNVSTADSNLFVHDYTVHNYTFINLKFY